MSITCAYCGFTHADRSVRPACLGPGEGMASLKPKVDPDKADAERFRWVIEKRRQKLHVLFALQDCDGDKTRALIDAGMAEERKGEIYNTLLGGADR